MITRAVEAGVPAGWVAGDEVYGADPRLRATIREHGLGYVLQVAANRRVPTDAGPIRVDQLPALLPAWVWQRRSAGTCSKGKATGTTPGPGSRSSPNSPPAIQLPPAARVTITCAATTPPAKLVYHRCQSPRPVPLSTLVKVAGKRWRIEESFQAAKTLTGIDQHQVRRWTSWHRWTTLAMLAHAFLAVATAAAERDHTPQAGLIELTVNEFRRLFDALLLTAGQTISTLLAWSRWRRRHQARARDSHYKRREN